MMDTLDAVALQPVPRPQSAARIMAAMQKTTQVGWSAEEVEGLFGGASPKRRGGTGGAP